MTTPKLTVGQTLYYEPDARWDHVRRGEVTVAKIGRTWATLTDGRRIDLATWAIDGSGYTSPGRCYPSREAWMAERNRVVAWGRLRDLLQLKYVPPDSVTEAHIRDAAALLGIALPAAGSGAGEGGGHG